MDNDWDVITIFECKDTYLKNSLLLVCFCYSYLDLDYYFDSLNDKLTKLSMGDNSTM